MALAKNTRTGKVMSVPAHYIGHSVLGKNLVAYGEEVSAAPKKENKKKAENAESKKFSWSASADKIEEQPAPAINIENEEIEDGN
jgi:hypothetical protein